MSDVTAYPPPTANAPATGESAHVAQFYDSDAFLLDTVNEFIGSALTTGAAGIVIATREHLQELELRWQAQGIDPVAARESGQYVPLEAAETLAKLLLDGWPQARRFADIVEPVVAAATRRYPRVKVFGELVRLLYQQGTHSAAVRLEELWEELTRRHSFSLLCAYPMSEFAVRTHAQPLFEICRLHSQVIPTESYASVTDSNERLRVITQLQQKAHSLEREFEARTALEHALTERENELRDINRRKDEFLATLAHELRNPLAPIRNAVEILRVAESDRNVSASARQLIDRQVTHLVRLIDDLLDLSRITQDRFALRRERMDLAAAVQLALETSQPLIENKQHQLKINWASEPLLVDADATRLAQVFGNLLSNSAKYSKPGSSITVTLGKEAEGAFVTITDTGFGIPPERLPRIFDMFERVDRGPDHTQDGLGIGLTLVKRIVELHGGHVEAHSDGVDCGSRFTVTLPLWKLGSEGPSARSGASESESVVATCRRILVVDDNRDSATSLAMMLSLDGHDVRMAYDGHEALRLAEEFRPDVVLLDIGMPRLDGYGVARRMRKRQWSQDTLLVALTGWGQQEDKRRASEAGFDGHLVKPVQPEVVRALIEEMRVPA